MAAIFSMMSIRLPFGRPLYVGGKRETNCSHNVAGLSIVSSKWFSADAAALPDCISNLYSFHAVPFTVTDALARTWPERSATSATLTGSAPSEPLFAWNDPVYLELGRTAIPQYPSFS